MKPPRTFKSINDLCDDINRNYSGAEVGKINNDNYRVTVGNNDGNYRVTEVGTGTIGVILEKLNGFLSKRDVKIIFLIAEETDGR